MPHTAHAALRSDRHDAEVFALAFYDRHHIELTPRNADFIFRDRHGSIQSSPSPRRTNLARDGLTGKVTLGVDPSASSAQA